MSSFTEAPETLPDRIPNRRFVRPQIQFFEQSREDCLECMVDGGHAECVRSHDATPEFHNVIRRTHFRERRFARNGERSCSLSEIRAVSSECLRVVSRGPSIPDPHMRWRRPCRLPFFIHHEKRHALSPSGSPENQGKFRRASSRYGAFAPSRARFSRWRPVCAALPGRRSIPQSDEQYRTDTDPRRDAGSICRPA